MDAGIYSIDAWGDPVGSGATAPRYCSLGGVAKTSSAGHEFITANEFVCGRLALLIGLPVPVGAIVEGDSGQSAYVSLRFGKKGERPPPVIIDDLVADQPRLAAGIVALDCWVANGDRHHENVAYVRGSLSVTVYDHSHALLGPGGDALARVGKPDEPFVGGQLAAALENDAHLHDWAARISGIPDVRVEEICADASAQGAVDAQTAEAASRFLNARKGRIIDLLKAAGNSLPKVQWGLL